MAHTIVTLRVTLDFDPEDVEQAEDFDPATQTPESYVRGALAGFLTNEINNCNEFPATAWAERTADLTGTVANLKRLARRLEDQRDAARAVVRDRLEYLRGEIHAERISQSEVIELQNLAPFIDRGDVELLEWAGVPEHACPQCERTDDCECEVGIV